MEKKSILDLYDRFSDEIYSKALNNNKLLDRISLLEDKLTGTLSVEQKQLLDNLNNIKNEKEELVYQEMFITGFSLAIKLFLEGLQEK